MVSHCVIISMPLRSVYESFGWSGTWSMNVEVAIGPKYWYSVFENFGRLIVHFKLNKLAKIKYLHVYTHWYGVCSWLQFLLLPCRFLLSFGSQKLSSLKSTACILLSSLLKWMFVGSLTWPLLVSGVSIEVKFESPHLRACSWVLNWFCLCSFGMFPW